MLKSIFAKYVITFVVLLLVSFTLLLFIVDSMYTNDSLRAERRDLRGVAASCAENLSDMYAAGGRTDFGDFVRNGASEGSVDGEYIRRVLDAIMTNFEDMTVYVTDASGGFIFSTGFASSSAPVAGTPLLRQEDFEAMSEEVTTASARASNPISGRSNAADEDMVLSGAFLSARSRWTITYLPAPWAWRTFSSTVSRFADR